SIISKLSIAFPLRKAAPGSPARFFHGAIIDPYIGLRPTNPRVAGRLGPGAASLSPVLTLPEPGSGRRPPPPGGVAGAKGPIAAKFPGGPASRAAFRPPPATAGAPAAVPGSSPD